MNTILFTLGWILFAGGLAAELIAMLAVGFYPIRRALPVSPIELQGMGCNVGVGGGVLLVIAAIVG